MLLMTCNPQLMGLSKAHAVKLLGVKEGSSLITRLKIHQLTNSGYFCIPFFLLLLLLRVIFCYAGSFRA